MSQSTSTPAAQPGRPASDWSSPKTQGRSQSSAFADLLSSVDVGNADSRDQGEARVASSRERSARAAEDESTSRTSFRGRNDRHTERAAREHGRTSAHDAQQPDQPVEPSESADAGAKPRAARADDPAGGPDPTNPVVADATIPIEPAAAPPADAAQPAATVPAIVLPAAAEGADAASSVDASAASPDDASASVVDPALAAGSAAAPAVTTPGVTAATPPAGVPVPSATIPAASDGPAPAATEAAGGAAIGAVGAARADAVSERPIASPLPQTDARLLGAADGAPVVTDEATPTVKGDAATQRPIGPTQPATASASKGDASATPAPDGAAVPAATHGAARAAIHVAPDTVQQQSAPDPTVPRLAAPDVVPPPPPVPAAQAAAAALAPVTATLATPDAASSTRAAAQDSGSVPIVGLAAEIAARAIEGKRRFEIRLDPPELGRIDVRLDIGRDGQVTSRLVVERAETLDLLRRDAPSLEQALQSAGLRTDGSGLQFSLRDQQSARLPFMDPMATPKLLIVPDEDVAVREAVRRGYGVLRGLGRGIDIQV